MTRPPGYDAAWAAFSLACATETSDEDALTATLTAAEPHIRAAVLDEIQAAMWAEEPFRLVDMDGRTLGQPELTAWLATFRDPARP